MRLAAPEWLLLLPALAVAARLYPRLGLRRALRALAVGAVALALAGPEVSSRSSGLDLWVLVDRSDSAAGAVAEGLPEWARLLDATRGRDDRVRWVAFGAAPQVMQDPLRERFEGGADATRLGLALRAAAAAQDPGRANRVLLLSDGFATDDVAGATAALMEAETAVDVRWVLPPEVSDVAVRRLEAPDRVAEGEAVLVEAELAGTHAGPVPFTLERDGRVIHAGEATLDKGVARVRLQDRPGSVGAHRYTLRLRPKGDGVPGNDAQERWVEVEGGPRLVLITSYPEGPLQAALRAGGYRVEVLGPEAADVGRLSGAAAVILEDVPAHRLSRELLAALPFYVQSQGGGLWMVGGKFSFGAGGYFESPLDPLLPVSMELRQEHKKLAVALAVVLDRSGSMAAMAQGARGLATKMSLAADGAARAVELLGAQDQVAVLAVDSEAHVIVPRVAVSSAREEILSTVRRIDSQGGGIYVYEGLSAGWRELKDAAVGQRHLILFSDAADSEEPGAYQALLETMREAGATVSVIGLGRPSDPDAKLLQDIADRGGGRIFFTEQAAEVPALFAQETVAVARSAFITEPAGVAEGAGWAELAPRPMRWLPVVDAYNLSYARPEAAVAARTQDETAAPLVAFWRRGAGRVAAVCFPLAGPQATEALAWSEYGEFVQSLARWLAREEAPPGVSLSARRVGSSLQVELLHDARWEAPLGRRPPRVAVSRGVGGAVEEPTWERVGPGRWMTRLELPREGYLRGAVQVGESALSLGPVSAGQGLEWQRSPEALAAVRALVAATGGAERVQLGDVWRAPRPPRFVSWAWLGLALGLVAFLVDALLTRTGHELPELAWPRRRPRAPRAPKASAPEAQVDLPQAPPPQGEMPPEDPEVAARRRRLTRAKR
jgi:Mg-chelatase subunit ChlD